MTKRNTLNATKSNWPTAGQFNESIQNVFASMADEELRGGVAAVNSMGLPLLYSGGFADVYQVHCPTTGRTWAVKCFTKGASGLRERYRKISELLHVKALPFTVDFEYQERGIRINGLWYPIVKMQWIEGKTLNEFVNGTVTDPRVLDQLFRSWIKLAARLDRESIVHADLQHGNVILVPTDDGSVLLKLIDYDGMWIPELAQVPSGEIGQANYQHPQRKSKQIYSSDVDRFSHLVICCALRCISVAGQELWRKYDNKENLLFVESDFQNPGESVLFHELWSLHDPDAHSMVGHLILATQANLPDLPQVHDLVDGKSMVRELTSTQEDDVRQILFGRQGRGTIETSATASRSPDDDSVFSEAYLAELQDRYVKTVQCPCGQSLDVTLGDLSNPPYCPSCGANVTVTQTLSQRSTRIVTPGMQDHSAALQQSSPPQFRWPRRILLALFTIAVGVATFLNVHALQQTDSADADGNQTAPVCTTTDVAALVDNPHPFTALILAQQWSRELNESEAPDRDERRAQVSQVSAQILADSKETMLSHIATLVTYENRPTALRVARNWLVVLKDLDVEADDPRRRRLEELITELTPE